MNEAATGASTPRHRAAVLSGGGAKGVFESGVLHALVRTGYEPDVITGSSVGAVNAATLAELVRTLREEGEPARDALLERTLRLWQSLDRWKIADFDRWGIRLILLCGAAALMAAGLGTWAVIGSPIPDWSWWIVRVASLAVGGALLASAGWLVWRWVRLPLVLARRIRRGMSAAPELRPPEPPVIRGWKRRALEWLGLYPSLFSGAGLEAAVRHLIPQGRRFSDYQRAGVELRLTRTNLRAGRVEISERVTRGQLLRPGAQRGQRVLGDPKVVPSVLASAAFPVAFPTVDAERLYPPADNPDLYGVIAERAHALRALRKLFGERADAELIWLHTILDSLAEEDPTLLRVGREGELYNRLKDRFIGDHAPWIRVATRTVELLIETRHWPELPLPEFAQHGDRYFDGGILDNTPLAPALAALRERQALDAAATGAEGGTVPAPVHDLLVVLLSPVARRRHLSAAASANLAGPELGIRALRLQAEERLAADARIAEKIDRLLARQEQDRVSAAAAPARAATVAEKPAIPSRRADLPSGDTWRELLERESNLPARPLGTLDVAVRETLARVELTRVVPSWDLPWVLALDDRLGFRAEDAAAFQARGCRDTLQSLVRQHRKRAAPGDEPPAHVARAAQYLGGGALSRPVLPGWVCRIEHCLLRGACDRISAHEAKSARQLGEVAASSG